MKFRKLTAALLCALLLIAALTGCKNTAVSETGDPSASPAASDEAAPDEATPDAAATDNAAPDDADPAGEETSSGLTLNAANAAAAFDPDEIIMTVNGREYDWQKFFYLINYYVNYLQYYNGELKTWDDTVMDGSKARDYIMDHSTDWALYDAAIRINAEKLGVELTEQDNAEIDESIQQTVERYGGSEGFEEQLKANFCTPELFREISETTALANKVFAELYGEHGEKLTDEEVAEYTAQDGYLMAKHILILTTKTDDEGNEVALEGDELAAARAKIDDIKAQLDACPPDQLDAKFDELMTEFSEDPGTESFPGGYLFQDGNMVKEFEDATKALEIGGYSDVVETDYGFHIIYRLPVDYDAVPSAYAYMQSGDEEYTLRYVTALGQFDSVVAAWQDSLDATYGDAYGKIDLEKMFA